MPSRLDNVENLSSHLESALAGEENGLVPESLAYSAGDWRRRVEDLRQWALQLETGERTDTDRFDLVFATDAAGINAATGAGWGYLLDNVETTAGDILADTKKVVTQPLGIPIEVWVFVAVVAFVAIHLKK